MNVLPFYDSGLRFSCARCSACCRHESGFVFLSRSDLDRLAAECRMDYTSFIKTWCRWTAGWPGAERLSLKEKANYDCIFWDKGCTVYHARPLQCRSFPFWETMLRSRGSWEAAAADCPGMGKGALHSREEIDAFLLARGREPCIERPFLETPLQEGGPA